jgi:hypothetical protein
MNPGRRASFLLPLSLVGCRKTASPVAAVEAFLDAYYVEQDHERALAVSADSAELRVRKEQALRAEAGGAYGVRPRVFYAKKRQQPAPGGGAEELTYEVSIDSSGVKFSKTVVLRVKKYGEDWKVSAFAERDEAPADARTGTETQP